jgi:hypothetical protein
MKIDPDAVEMLLDFQDEIEPRLAKDGDLRPLGGFAGKIKRAEVPGAAVKDPIGPVAAEMSRANRSAQTTYRYL